VFIVCNGMQIDLVPKFFGIFMSRQRVRGHGLSAWNPQRPATFAKAMQDDPDKDSAAEALRTYPRKQISNLAKKMGVSIDEVRRLIAEAAAEAEERKQNPPTPDSSITE